MIESRTLGRFAVVLLLASTASGCGATHRGNQPGAGGTTTGGTASAGSPATSSGGDEQGDAGAGGATCPPPLEVQQGRECSTYDACASQDNFVLDAQASCACVE